MTTPGPDPGMPVPTTFLATAAARGGRTAIAEPDRRVTYAELAADARAVAAGLRARGLAPGDRVAYLGRSRVELFALVLGAAAAGIVVVPVNWRLAPAEAGAVLRDADVSLLVAEAARRDLAGDAVAPEATVALDAGDGPGTWADLVAASAGGDPPPPGPDDALWIVYTSGTTGRPKGVVLTHANVAASASILVDAWRFAPDRVVYVPYPSFHVAGLAWVLFPLLVGATVVLRDGFDPDDLLATAAAEGVTNTMMVPSVLQGLLSAPAFDPAALATLRTVVYGVAPISEAVLARAVEALPGCEYVHAYGLTEATGTVTGLPWDEHRPGQERMRSCGRALPGVEVRVVDPATERDRAPGETGEVWVRSPMVMAGYFRQPEATAAATTPEGWLRTGDAGHLDAEGYLYLTDRITDMVITGGENVYPAEVENVLHAHPAVLEAAAVGVPDERWGETIRAVVVLRPGASADEAAVVAHCRDHLAHYKCPTSVDFVAALPKNPTGKVLRRQVREPYWEGRDRRIG